MKEGSVISIKQESACMQVDIPVRSYRPDGGGGVQTVPIGGCTYPDSSSLLPPLYKPMQASIFRRPDTKTSKRSSERE